MALYFYDVPLSCINQAAEKYAVPSQLIMAVITVEGGHNGEAILNKNGSVDYGVMQINSSWKNDFEKQGYDLYSIRYNSCSNVDFGTAILRQCLNNNHDLFSAIGDYHSYTPVYNEEYAEKVLLEYNKIMKQITAISPECKKKGLVC